VRSGIHLQGYTPKLGAYEVAGIALILSCFLMGIWSDWNVLVRKNALIGECVYRDYPKVCVNLQTDVR